MKPEGKEYEKEVIEPKVWESINGEHHLVTYKVSEYIRLLEMGLRTNLKGFNSFLWNKGYVVDGKVPYSQLLIYIDEYERLIGVQKSNKIISGSFSNECTTNDDLILKK